MPPPTALGRCLRAGACRHAVGQHRQAVDDYQRTLEAQAALDPSSPPSTELLSVRAGGLQAPARSAACTRAGLAGVLLGAQPLAGGLSLASPSLPRCTATSVPTPPGAAWLPGHLVMLECLPRTPVIISAFPHPTGCQHSHPLPASPPTPQPHTRAPTRPAAAAAAAVHLPGVLPEGDGPVRACPPGPPRAVLLPRRRPAPRVQGKRTRLARWTDPHCCMRCASAASGGSKGVCVDGIRGRGWGWVKLAYTARRGLQ